MSSTVASIIVLLLSQLLPYIGVNLGTEQLTTTVQVLVAIIVGVVTWVQTLKLKGQVHGPENVNVFGGIRR